MLQQTEDLKKFCLSVGADFVGIADMTLLAEDGVTEVEEKLKYPYAVSIAVKLDDKILNDIEDSPTKDYADHYREVNKRLDEIAKNIAEHIGNSGFRSFIIPASKIVDEKNLAGTLSHKAIARLAGIGWQGKSLLIINPFIGPRFRLVTILTDMPLVPDKPIKNRCGGCILCYKHCPATAIKNVNTSTYYHSREEAIDLQRCYQKLLNFKMIDGVNATVCGICVKVCPYGRRKKR